MYPNSPECERGRGLTSCLAISSVVLRVDASCFSGAGGVDAAVLTCNEKYVSLDYGKSTSMHAGHPVWVGGGRECA